MDVITKHAKYPHIIFKLAKTREEISMCIKTYAEISIVDNEFIKQMNISAQEFYEQGLLPYVD